MSQPKEKFTAKTITREAVEIFKEQQAQGSGVMGWSQWLSIAALLIAVLAFFRAQPASQKPNDELAKSILGAGEKSDAKRAVDQLLPDNKVGGIKPEHIRAAIYACIDSKEGRETSAAVPSGVTDMRIGIVREGQNIATRPERRVDATDWMK